MGELLTCKCGGQEWTLSSGNAACQHCGQWPVLGGLALDIRLMNTRLQQRAQSSVPTVEGGPVESSPAEKIAIIEELIGSYNCECDINVETGVKEECIRCTLLSVLAEDDTPESATELIQLRAIVQRLRNLDWCIGYALTPDQHEELDNIRTAAYTLNKVPTAEVEEEAASWRWYCNAFTGGPGTLGHCAEQSEPIFFSAVDAAIHGIQNSSHLDCGVSRDHSYSIWIERVTANGKISERQLARDLLARGGCSVEGNKISPFNACGEVDADLVKLCKSRLALQEGAPSE